MNATSQVAEGHSEAVRLLEEKWGPPEVWNSSWNSFVRERLSLKTPNLEIIARLLAGHRILHGAKALDVGCGEGGLVRALEERGATVTAVEINRRDLTLFRILRSVNGWPKGNLLRASGTKLPFRSGSFDLVTAVEVIEHVSRPEDLVAELFRVARAGGLVLVTTPNFLLPYEPHVRLFFVHWLPGRARKRVIRWRRARYKYAQDLHYLEGMGYFTRGSLQRLLSEFTDKTQDLTEEWLQEVARRANSGQAATDPFVRTVLPLILRLSRGSDRLQRLILFFLPLKFLCEKTR